MASPRVRTRSWLRTSTSRLHDQALAVQQWSSLCSWLIRLETDPWTSCRFDFDRLLYPGSSEIKPTHGRWTNFSEKPILLIMLQWKREVKSRLLYYQRRAFVTLFRVWYWSPAAEVAGFFCITGRCPLADCLLLFILFYFVGGTQERPFLLLWPKKACATMMKEDLESGFMTMGNGNVEAGVRTPAEDWRSSGVYRWLSIVHDRIVNLSDLTKLGLCAVGIFVCYLLFGVYQEKV